MKKFRANYGTRIEELEILRETEHTIVYLDSNGKEQRDYKKTHWSSWHDSKEAAINYLVAGKQKEIEGHLKNIEYIKEQIDKIYKL